MTTPAIPRTLNFITGNANKLAEVRQILGPGLEKQGITLTSQSVEVEEIQGSIEDVSVRKCESAARVVSYFFFFEPRNRKDW